MIILRLNDNMFAGTILLDCSGYTFPSVRILLSAIFGLELFKIVLAYQRFFKKNEEKMTRMLANNATKKDVKTRVTRENKKSPFTVYDPKVRYFEQMHINYYFASKIGHLYIVPSQTTHYVNHRQTSRVASLEFFLSREKHI